MNPGLLLLQSISLQLQSSFSAVHCVIYGFQVFTDGSSRKPHFRHHCCDSVARLHRLGYVYVGVFRKRANNAKQGGALAQAQGIAARLHWGC